MFTNIKEHGGNFIDVVDKEFLQADSVTIASGYALLNIINRFEGEFLSIIVND